MEIELFDKDTIAKLVQQRMEVISVGLMKAENKDFCLASVSSYDWRLFCLNQTGCFYVAVPSAAFNRFIFNRIYLKVVDAYPDCFGTKDDWEIVKAIKQHEQNQLVKEYNLEEYFDYIKGETASYIFKIESENALSDKVLRLDLCRGINKNKQFMGGIFHILKHFTLGGYQTLSSFGKEFSVESWAEIYHNIITNFFH